MSVMPPEQVRELFGIIASKYDMVNYVLSLGQMERWRQEAVQWADLKEGHRVLDAFCGTGGLALAASRMTPNICVIGVDFTPEMVQRAREKMQNILRECPLDFRLADVISLPFPDEYFDRILIGFGLRHLSDLEKGIAELYRVLKKGGILVNLDTNPPSTPLLGSAYSFLFHWVVPVLGWMFTRNWNGYAYFGKTIKQFPCKEELLSLFHKKGFVDGAFREEFGGAITLYRIEK
ncbi:MAG: ubiquinone/menaquinone biosynthesis methyltransferase [bacterium JZ-2024 1]